MTDRKTGQRQQENRSLHFWFNQHEENQYVDDTNEFMNELFHTDEFPRGRSQCIQSNECSMLFLLKITSRLSND